MQNYIFTYRIIFLHTELYSCKYILHTELYSCKYILHTEYFI